MINKIYFRFRNPQEGLGCLPNAYDVNCNQCSRCCSGKCANWGDTNWDCMCYGNRKASQEGLQGGLGCKPIRARVTDCSRCCTGKCQYSFDKHGYIGYVCSH